MQQKYKKKGLVLVGLSYEPRSKVGPHVARNKMSYIVGAEANGTKEAYGVRGFPTAFLIDPDGKVAWKGHPLDAEEAIEKLLRSNPPKAGNTLDELAARTAFKRAAKRHKDGQYARALRDYEKIVKDFEGTEAAKRARARVRRMKAEPDIVAAIKQEETERNAKRWLDSARMMANHGAEQDAARYYRRIIREYPESKYAEIARNELADLRRGEPDA